MVYHEAMVFRLLGLVDVCIHLHLSCRMTGFVSNAMITVYHVEVNAMCVEVNYIEYRTHMYRIEYRTQLYRGSHSIAAEQRFGASQLRRRLFRLVGSGSLCRRNQPTLPKKD